MQTHCLYRRKLTLKQNTKKKPYGKPRSRSCCTFFSILPRGRVFLFGTQKKFLLIWKKRRHRRTIKHRRDNIIIGHVPVRRVICTVEVYYESHAARKNIGRRKKTEYGDCIPKILKDTKINVVSKVEEDLSFARET